MEKGISDLLAKKISCPLVRRGCMRLRWRKYCKRQGDLGEQKTSQSKGAVCFFLFKRLMQLVYKHDKMKPHVCQFHAQ